MIVAKIDVTKIDKSKLYVGEKGTYLEVVLIETPNSKYGDDYMAVQGVTQEEREAGKKGAILGNAKTIGVRPSPQTGGNTQRREPEPEMAEDDIPF